MDALVFPSIFLKLKFKLEPILSPVLVIRLIFLFLNFLKYFNVAFQKFYLLIFILIYKQKFSFLFYYWIFNSKIKILIHLDKIKVC